MKKIFSKEKLSGLKKLLPRREMFSGWKKLLPRKETLLRVKKLVLRKDVLLISTALVVVIIIAKRNPAAEPAQSDKLIGMTAPASTSMDVTDTAPNILPENTSEIPPEAAPETSAVPDTATEPTPTSPEETSAADDEAIFTESLPEETTAAPEESTTIPQITTPPEETTTTSTTTATTTSKPAETEPLPEKWEETTPYTAPTVSFSYTWGGTAFLPHADIAWSAGDGDYILWQLCDGGERVLLENKLESTGGEISLKNHGFAVSSYGAGGLFPQNYTLRLVPYFGERPQDAIVMELPYFEVTADFGGNAVISTNIGLYFVHSYSALSVVSEGKRVRVKGELKPINGAQEPLVIDIVN